VKKRIIELSTNNRNEVLELPVNPPSFELLEPQLNQKITLLNVGEANLPGNSGLATTSLESFFPAENSPFFRYAKRKPNEYVTMIEKWKTEKAVVRLIVTDLSVNLAMLIDNFNRSQKEGSDDILYKIDLSEYRTLNVPTVQSAGLVRNNGLKSRPDTSRSGGTYTVVKGDTLWGIAKRFYGNGNSYAKIQAANAGQIKNPNKIYPGQIFVIPA
jgi:nucleoid-associated protein YgaU